MLKSSSTTARLGHQLPSSPSPLPAAEAYPGAPTWREYRLSMVRWLFPSLTDMIFAVLVAMLVFAPMGAGLLHDADTGWHIRNGQHIAATLSVPHTDDFSYTMNGKPWFAWEWLYDAGIGLLAARLGLNGIVLFTAAVIAFTLALLFRTLVLATGNLFVSAFLAVLASLSAQVHMLARPHVMGWLLTLVWVRLLYRFQDGKISALWWLPGLMLVWVNVHGSFVLGLVLLALFACGNLWTYAVSTDAVRKREASVALSRFGVSGAFSALATF